MQPPQLLAYELLLSLYNQLKFLLPFMAFSLVWILDGMIGFQPR